MSFGTQRNGLAVEIENFDTIGVHDYADSSAWPAVDDSSWALDPTDPTSKYYGKVVKVTELQLDISEDIVMHDGGELVVEFFMTGNPNPVATYTYSSMADWISRSNEKKKIDNTGVVGSFLQYNIMFATPPLFWASAGVDAAGGYKLNKMTVRIADNVSYKNGAGEPAQIARPRYYAEVYADPDL